MQNLHAILFGELRPWINRQTEEFYESKINALTTVQAKFPFHYELNFFRHFSDRTLYYQKIITNDIITYCNTLFEETHQATLSLTTYVIDNARRKIHAKIIHTGKVINYGKFDLFHLNSPADIHHRENAHIINYLLSALIKEWLEIQHQFRSCFAETSIWEVPDFYTRLLKVQPPEQTFIKEIQQPATMPTATVPAVVPAPKKDCTAQLTADNYAIFMREVGQYQFAELPKYRALSPENQTRLIQKIVTGSVPYAVAMLNLLEYPQHLKNVFAMPKERQYSHIAKSLNAIVRSVKGNFLALNPASKEDRQKYTALENEKKVKNDYFLLTRKQL